MRNIYSNTFYFALFSISSMTILGSTTIAPSLPNLEKHFNSVENIELLTRLVLTLPALFIVFISPISGFLYDKYKRLALIYPAMIVWSISGISGFFLDNIYLILISRAIFGIATAFVMTGASVLIADYYSGVKRENALRIQNFFTALGGALFLILGGFLSNINWRFPFLVYLLGFIIFVFAKKMLFEPNKSITKVPTSSSFNFFTFLPVYMLAFFSMAMFYISPTQAPFFITKVLNKSGALVGISLAVSSLSTAVGSLFYAKFRIYLKLNQVYILSLCTMGFGYCLVYIFHSYVILLISFVLIGFSLGIILITNSSWLFSLTNENNRAKAYGFLASSMFMGQFCSPFITNPVLNHFGIIKMFLIFGVVLIIVGLLFLTIKQKL